jgi:DNA polymerase-3 subunit epsilon
MEGQQLSETTFAVVDIETTGIDRKRDAIVEVACVLVRGGVEVGCFSTLVDPRRPIPARTAAIHHITDADVRGAPTIGTVAPLLASLCADAVVVAHNAGFDLGFLPLLAPRPRLCTLRLARHVCPELHGHANQFLRYALDVRIAGEAAAHRALGDARVTAAILRVLLRRFREQTGRETTAALIELAASPIRRAGPWATVLSMPTAAETVREMPAHSANSRPAIRRAG